jgi:hypothetical protein
MLPRSGSSGREAAAKEGGVKGLRLINDSSKTLGLSGWRKVEAEGTECVS